MACSVTPTNPGAGAAMMSEWLTDIFMEWKEVNDETVSVGRRDRLVSWTIEDVRVRNERLEREEQAAMPKAVGCTQAHGSLR